MILYSHPFNNRKEKTCITKNTQILILGSFPTHEVLCKKSPLNYFYGSKKNKFWELLEKSSIINKINENSIIETFEIKKIGIIDIINKCYRKNDESSLDIDLSIVEFFNIQKLLFEFTNISVILTTSNIVRDLLFKNQLNALRAGKIEIVTLNNIRFEKISLFNRDILIKNLPSPSMRNTMKEDVKMKEYGIIFNEAFNYIQSRHLA